MSKILSIVVLALALLSIILNIFIFIFNFLHEKEQRRRAKKIQSLRYEITLDDLCLMTARTQIMFCEVDDYRAWLNRNGLTDPLIAITIDTYDRMADKLESEVSKDFDKLVYRMIASVENKGE